MNCIKVILSQLVYLVIVEVTSGLESGLVN